MIATREPESFLPLSHLAFHILLALGEGPAHGYAIGKEAEERTSGKLKPTTGGLYQALRRLKEDGLVATSPKATAESSDARRQYFELTPLGHRVLRAELQRLKSIIAEAEASDLLPRSV
jgi:DNA-binding PadR family transcriptional regulator